MVDAFDPPEEFDNLGHDRSGRWRFTRQLVESFWGPIESEHGTPESALGAAEARLAGGCTHDHKLAPI